MTTYLVVQRWFEEIFPGNWYVDPYWQARNDLYLASSLPDVDEYCKKIDPKLKIWFTNPPITEHPHDYYNCQFPDCRHWRVFEMKPGVVVDLRH